MFLISSAEADLVAASTQYAVNSAISAMFRVVRPGHVASVTLDELDELKSNLLRAAEALPTEEAEDPESETTVLRNFLSSPEFSVFVEHVAYLTLSARLEEHRDLVRDEFVHFIALYGPPTPTTTTLRRALAELMIRIISESIPESSKAAIATSRISSADKDRAIEILLAAIERHLRIMTDSSAPSLDECKRYLERLRNAVGNRFSEIIPPSFADKTRVPIDELYVAPSIHPSASTVPGSALALEDFVTSLGRCVLLGDPGGGKSTLVAKIASDLARGGRQYSPCCPELLLAFPVVLREYDAYLKEHSASIIDFMEHEARTRYQLPPLNGVFEWLLSTGRLLVIFDGLDELLDTSGRLEMTRRVEAFCDSYPGTNVLVTSRKVGYEEAPLKASEFARFEIDHFSPDQISEYVHKWFALDQHSLDETTRQAKVDAFLAESATVSDLISNALLLALMCTIYQGENYIPRNRPAVYEKCAKMLFERWDTSRGIDYQLPFEAYVDPAIKDLAFWMFSDESLQGGVTEHALIARASEFLEAILYTGAEYEAERAAQHFIEFCRGRAWVFTDTGSLASGERIYQFTHRTFLEYFAAAHLVRTSDSPTSLLRILTPRIGRAEWDMVALLAVHQLTNERSGAFEIIMDRLATILTNPRATIRRRTNVAAFLARSLSSLVGPRDVVTRICSLIWSIHRERSLVPPERGGADYNLLLEPLKSVATDNRSALIQAIVAHFETVRYSSDDLEAFIGAIGILSDFWATGGRNWIGVRIADDSSGSEDLCSILEDAWNRWPWAVAGPLWRSHDELAGYVAHFGIEALFLPKWVPGTGMLFTSFVERSLWFLIGGGPDSDENRTGLVSVLSLAGSYLEANELSVKRLRYPFVPWIVTAVEFRYEDQRPIKLSDQELRWAGYLCAADMELTQGNITPKMLDRAGSWHHLEFMKTAVRARMSKGEPGPWTSELARVDPSGRLEAWAKKDLSFVHFLAAGGRS
jgi:hypothetical protein